MLTPQQYFVNGWMAARAYYGPGGGIVDGDDQPVHGAECAMVQGPYVCTCDLPGQLGEAVSQAKDQGTPGDWAPKPGNYLPKPESVYDFSATVTDEESEFGADLYNLLTDHGLIPSWSKRTRVIMAAIKAIREETGNG